MFTKRKHVGSAHAFKKVIDWDAIWGTTVLGLLILVCLSQCGG